MTIQSMFATLTVLQYLSQMSNFYFGLCWDKYTPAVEGQIARDMIALSSNKRPEVNLIACVIEPDANQLLASMNIKYIPNMVAAKLWILYKATFDNDVDAPEHATTVIVRELAVKDAKGSLSTDEFNGFYLPEQGRWGPDSISMHRPAPNGYAPPDPQLIMLWC